MHNVLTVVTLATATLLVNGPQAVTLVLVIRLGILATFSFEAFD